MIYLQFSEIGGKPQYKKIEKPRFSIELEALLEEYYQVAVAKKYAKIVVDFLYDKMKFPEEGIYYVDPQSETLNIFSKEQNAWIDTKKTFGDYIIEPEDEIWKHFFMDNCFFKNLADAIKQIVKKSTQNMFCLKDMKTLSSIDLDTGEAFQNETEAVSGEGEILTIFMDYFAKKRAKDLYSQFKKIIFPIEDDNYIMLLTQGRVVSMLTAKGTSPLNDNIFELLQERFKEELAEEELKKFVSGVWNQLFFGKNFCEGKILYLDDYERPHIERNGVELIVDQYNDSWYYQIITTRAILEEMAEIIKKETIGTFRGNECIIKDHKLVAELNEIGLSVGLFAYYTKMKFFERRATFAELVGVREDANIGIWKFNIESNIGEEMRVSLI